VSETVAAITLANLPAVPGTTFEGGIYAGVTSGLDGYPVGHLVLLPDKPANLMNWANAKAWAEGLGAGARLPSRAESALLYANLREQIDDTRWHWTGTEFDASYAWYCYFNDGGQFSNHKSYEGCARAVRLIPLSV
jgi:hypothetical protein